MSNQISTVEIKAARECSALCWEMAKDTADNETAAAEWQAQGEACDDHYADALAAIEAGNPEGALESLEQARSLEAEGGDDQHARRAIVAVKASWLIAETALLVGNDGTGDLGVIVRQALKDDPNATAEDIAEIVREAQAEAQADRT